MEEKLHETDKIEDLMMPGFRFHPTDEELVGFYLKRKIQQRQLPVELIKQVDIYKYDPWDLPKLASSTGEKEWYFYCPRDRKYRNSVRPNRVTGAGFWKATGTDRPIYSSDGSKCIGLKKSLVFYRGRAAKGLKTDWMMHEFRLPSSSSSSSSVPPANTPKKILDKSLPPNDAWAICRIFKKANSNAQRALAHAWLIPLPDPSSSEMLSQGVVLNNQPFSSETVSYNTDMESNMQQWDNNNLQRNSCTTGSDINVVSSQHLNTIEYKPSFLGDLPENFMLSQQDISELTNNYTLDSAASVLHTITGDSVSTENIFGYSQQQNYNDFSIDSSPEIDEVGLLKRQRISNVVITSDHHQLSEEITTVGFPFSLPSNLGNAWKKPHLAWGSPNCPSELSTSKCYT